MMLLGTQRVNDHGVLEIGGCDAVQLARRFGTPLYLLDEDCFRQTCRSYRRAFESRYPDVLIAFAGKAFLTTALCRIAHQEGLGLDVASAGELHTALKAGFPTERLFLHGSNKSPDELEMGVQHRVGRIVVDSLPEIADLQSVALRLGAVADVLVRVTPGVQVNTHTHVQTGKVDSKFGLCIVDGSAREGVSRLLASPNLRFRGIHCHIGSQILDLAPFREAAEMMLDFAADLHAGLGVAIADLDLGGGLGVHYQSSDQPPSLDDYAETVVSAVRSRCDARSLPLPRLLQEPGRRLVGEAGTTLYTVGVVKQIPGVRTYVSVDGGLSDNPRPALYGARYEAIVANKAAQPSTQTVTIVGKHCESDVLIFDLPTPPIAPGDILAVQTTGAYNHSMASNYNRLPRPAAVLVSRGRADLMVRREVLADLVRCDRLPGRLRKPTP
jgi:diaminopimelate decarboxylase